MKAMFGRAYTYEKTEYTALWVPVTVTCKVHGVFTKRPVEFLSKGRRCPLCEKQEDIIKRAKAVHGDHYSYAKLVYRDYREPVVITCAAHGDFEQTPNVHLSRYKSGCQKCAVEGTRKATYTTEWFVEASKEKHGAVYRYPKVEYTGIRQPVTLTCRTHGAFTTSPYLHLYTSRGGCPDCRESTSKGYSKLAMEWLAYEAKQRGIRAIQHAANGGEFYIPGTRYKVDGYHKRSNTIFEFHGNRFHGNPKIYKPRDRPHPYSTKSAAQLYKETKTRERHIRSLGYNLVVMWESDFKKIRDAL